ncbi:MAG: amino acid adenylation domain-containing protein, partial [Myxococcota bacterium]
SSPPPLPATLHGRVLLRCRMHPERRAVASLSYGQLDRRSAALAKRLPPAPRVAVLAHPGEEAVIALMAVMRSGAAYVPLDPGWPARRIAQVIAQARVDVLVTTEACGEQVAALGEPPGTVLVVDGDEADEGPEAVAELAYVMFTSGTTGKPKGVVVRHAEHLAWQAWVSRAFGVTEDDRFLQTSSLGFGGSLRQIFTPLLHGASCHPVSRDVLRDPDALMAFVAEERITIYNSVPSLLMHLIPAIERADASGKDVMASVRWVLLGGEAVPADLIRRWRSRVGVGRCRVANLYGSTETIVNATMYEIVAEPPPDDPHTPIGWPRMGTTVYLLDVTDGVGEIAVGGEIAAGYLFDEAVTAAAFIDHPEHGRLYRTGDLARRREDGAFVYLGRKDSQVQVHGNRVELAEIEHTLADHGAVDQAIVVWTGGRLIASYEGRPVPDGTLQAHIASRLPDYMIPARVHLVTKLPRNPAGKADRKALMVKPGAAESVPVAGSLAAQIGAAWQQVLGLDTLPGGEADFFALGGDSIGVLEVFEQLRDRLPETTRPMLLYRHRTLADFAAALEAVRPEAAPARSSRAGTLSEVQRGFLTADQGGSQPIWSVMLPLHGTLDVAALRASVDWLVARHPQLRATFHVERHGPVQRIHSPAPPMRLQFDDLGALPEEMHESIRAARWAEDAHARFDLEQGPLLRLRLLRRRDDRHDLLITSHHVVTDAWSCWVMAGELVEAHDAFRSGRRPTLPPPQATYQELTRATPPDDPWWKDNLAGLMQRPAAPSAGASAGFSLSAEEHVQLQATARRASVSPFVLVLSAYAEALMATCGVEDVVIATALADRDGDPRRKAVVGAFARGLPVRLRGEATPAAVGAALGAALAHAGASTTSIGAALGREALAVLGRYFLSWLDPRAVPAATQSGGLAAVWAGSRFRFAAASTRTEVMCGALVSDGLHLNLHGGTIVPGVAAALERALRARLAPAAALIVYAPDGLPIPLSSPRVIETIEAPDGVTEIVALPLSAGALHRVADLDAQVGAAMAVSRAPVIALAGMLPALTGLGQRPLCPGKILTTGHSVTVVAMVRHVEHVLGRLGRRWDREVVAVLGYGAIGRAVFALCQRRMGAPGRLLLVDPALPQGDQDPAEASLILGATSGGATLDVESLRAGTVVIDDSFPSAFDTHAARMRMEQRQDVLLVGGGQLDVGPLRRTSPLPGAAQIRARFPAQWLPGCHAEALLLAAKPSLGPTVGVVSEARACEAWDAVEALGWRVPPLHLQTWIVPESLLDMLANRAGEGG